MKIFLKGLILLMPIGLMAQGTQAQNGAITYTITTVAGNGTAGYGGDGGQATAAEINEPQGVCVDDAGNLYLSEAGSDVVRRVDGQTGIITTVAGNGTAGYSGDGGQATAAQLKDPAGLVIDQSGNLIIVDESNYVIRQVNLKTGIITTIAGDGTAGSGGDGGAALSAQFSDPYQIAIDQSGNLYIGDGGANRIRKIDKATGTITTVAGNGTAGNTGDGGPATAAELNIPYGVAVDKAGNIYIACHGSSTIRKVDKATGNITTIAGTGTAGYTGEGGPAIQAMLSKPINVSIGNNGEIYVCDAYNKVIRLIDPTTGIIKTIAGGSSGSALGDGGPALYAYIAYTWAMALDADDNVYVAGVNGNRIRKVFPAFSVDFAVADTSVCLNDSVHFENLSNLYDSSLSISYEWQFPGGNPAISTDRNPAVSYTQSGTYTAKLIAIADSNGLFSDFITKEFKITVSTPNSVSITGKGLITAGEQDTLTASGATNYLWSTGATTATIVVSPAQTTVYSVIGDNGEGSCPGTDTFTVTVDTTGNGGDAGIHELAKNNRVTLYPNPSGNKVYIKFENQSRPDKATLQIITTDGRIIAQKKLTVVAGQQVVPVDIAQIAPGAYIIKITSDTMRQAIPFLKQ